MKNGRDWGIWKCYGYFEEMDCVAKDIQGRPFPNVLRNSEGTVRLEGNVFVIKTWGTKGYK